MRSDRDRLDDMLAAADMALRLAGRSSPSARDDAVVFAITYQLIVIGEAARAVSEETRRDLPNIPWPDIVGLRNFIVHAYWKIDETRLWRTVEDELPMMATSIRLYVSASEDR